MIDCYSFDNCLKKHGFSGACRRDYERPLSVTNWRDQVDRSSCELGTALRRTPCLELELSLGIRCYECAEVRTPKSEIRLAAVDLRYLRDNCASALIASCRCKYCIAPSQIELTCEVGRNVRIRRIGEIAVGGAANESAVARGIIPTCRFAVGDNRGHRLSRTLVRALVAVVATASALIAVAAAVATIVALVAVAALTLPVLLLPMVVLLLLLLRLVIVRRRRSSFL